MVGFYIIPAPPSTSNTCPVIWYDKCINKSNKIIAAIDKEYGASETEKTKH
jgi:hypothetical protein